MVYEMQEDIFFIQETKMIKADEKPNLPGYVIKRRDRQRNWEKRKTEEEE